MAGAEERDVQEASEEAFFFEHEGRRLFAMADSPPRPRGIGWVFCHPYAEEKQFTYRILARFARRMAQEGFPVLRFDCGGYGDSEGELHESTIETQVAETLVAADLARERLGVERLGLLGLRFGASVAALAAARRTDLEALVLWSPIVQGQRYLDGLIRKELFAHMVRGQGSRTRQDVLDELARAGRIDFEGHFLTREMADQLAAVDLPASIDHGGEVLVASIRNRRGRYAEFEKLIEAYQAKGANCTLELAEDSEYWDISAMNLWRFPDELYESTLDWLRSRFP